jgi:shikimate 5-dehydrogenase/shikimate kinase
MRTLIVGHRGVGKTSFLSRAKTYYESEGREGVFLDLDQEITRRMNRTPSDVFANEGEAKFREMEREVFRAIDAETSQDKRDVYVVGGGGFDPAFASDAWRVLWVRRLTDAVGRIFLDRPRLNTEVSPLAEYQERFTLREARFRARADECVWLDEGLEGEDPDEASFVLSAFHDLGGALTLLPQHFARESSLAKRLEARVRWGVRWFELRDDLLSEEQMKRAIALLPKERLLVSFRAQEREESTRRLIKEFGLAFDWPLERGASPSGEPKVLSLHERREGQSITEALARFPTSVAKGTLLKAALPTRDFSELAEGHAWCAAQPASRIFLPHSPDGRWSWYRLFQGSRYDLNFIREDEGSGVDQPTLMQWSRRRRLQKDLLALPLGAQGFAALLGDPASHSRTPAEQREYFEKVDASVFSIRVTEEEWRKGAIDFLQTLGLRWAAVTAPLKALAYESCRRMDSVCDELRAVNTLRWREKESDDEGKSKGHWEGINTDLEGFASAFSANHPPKPVAVWGGGGTLGVVRMAVQGVQAYSVRTGENRETGGVPACDFAPATVIWAIGRSREAANLPPANWKPEVVFDLNYAEDSPGREYALKLGCRYISGLAMFRAQAEAQRQFWLEE